MTNHKLQYVPILKMDCSFPIDTSGRFIIFVNHQYYFGYPRPRAQNAFESDFSPET